ncbi:FANCI solenoid 4-domain-containing protein [Parasitella parasitica]|nr:FANCI solenoid 4-domain-containing protein [Parasitella parasitica]
MKSYEKDPTILNPIKLDVCVENANNGGAPKIIEPVHILLSNLVNSLRVAATVDVTATTAESMSRCKDHLLSFVSRLSRATLEDFELDKTASLDMATHIGLRNNFYTTLLIGVYEVSLEHIFLTNDITTQSSEILLTLFKKRTALFSKIKDSSTNEKGRKNTNIAQTSCVSLEFTSKMFQSIFSTKDTKEENEGSKRDIRSNLDFANFLVTSTCDSLKQAIDDTYYQQDNEHFKYCITVCRIYLSILRKEDSNSTYANQQSTKKSPSVLGAIAASLLKIFEIVSHVWPQRLVQFLDAIIEKEDKQQEEDLGRFSKSTNLVILDLVNEIKIIVGEYLNGNSPIYKEAVNVMQVVVFLCKKLEKTDQDYLVRTRHIVSWLNNLAKTKDIEDVSLARDITALLLKLCSNVSEFDTIQKICEDIHLTTGDLEVANQDSDIDTSITYQIVNSKTCATITSKVFEFIDASFDDLTWGIGRLKLCAANDSVIENTRDFEIKTCKRLTSLLLILSELVKSNLQGLHAENLFKTLAKAYKTLHTLVKYKMLFPEDISPDFISVISKSGTEITEKMYKFLTVYGQSQSHTQDTSSNSRKKKGKKKEINQKQKLKIQRESKMIPNLIFTVEQFERYLIQLSRKSKVDFMQYMKRSTSRDFRIHMSIVQASSDEEDENEEEGEELGKKRLAENLGEPSKRSRTN